MAPSQWQAFKSSTASRRRSSSLLKLGELGAVAVARFKKVGQLRAVAVAIISKVAQLRAVAVAAKKIRHLQSWPNDFLQVNPWRRRSSRRFKSKTAHAVAVASFSKV